MLALQPGHCSQCKAAHTPLQEPARALQPSLRWAGMPPTLPVGPTHPLSIKRCTLHMPPCLSPQMLVAVLLAVAAAALIGSLANRQAWNGGGERARGGQGALEQAEEDTTALLGSEKTALHPMLSVRSAHLSAACSLTHLPLQTMLPTSCSSCRPPAP